MKSTLLLLLVLTLKQFSNENNFQLIETFRLWISFTLHLYLSLNILSQKEHLMFFIFKWVELIWRLKWSAFMNPTPHSEHKWGLKVERVQNFQWLILWLTNNTHFEYYSLLYQITFYHCEQACVNLELLHLYTSWNIVDIEMDDP